MDAEECVVVKSNPGTRFRILARLAKIMKAEGGLTLSKAARGKHFFPIFEIVYHRNVPCI